MPARHHHIVVPRQCIGHSSRMTDSAISLAYSSPSARSALRIACLWLRPDRTIESGEITIARKLSAGLLLLKREGDHLLHGHGSAGLDGLLEGGRVQHRASLRNRITCPYDRLRRLHAQLIGVAS
jgi:hypothetical protein